MNKINSPPQPRSAAPGSSAYPDNGFDGSQPRLLDILYLKRYTISTIALAVVVLGAGVAMTLPPRYRATTHILIGQPKNSVLTMAQVVEGLSPDSTTLHNQLEIMRSRTLAAKVINSLGLQNDPAYAGEGRGLFNELLKKIGLSRRDEKPSPTTEGVPTTTINRFVVGLDIQPIVLSTVVAISYSSENADKAAKIANGFAEGYLNDQLDAKFEATHRATSWLTDRLLSLSEQVRRSEEAVEAYRSQQGLTDSSGAGRTSVGDQVAELSGQITEARADCAAKEAKFQQVTTMLRAGRRVDTVADVMSNGVIVALRSQQTDIIRRLADARSRYGEGHPTLQAIRDEQRKVNEKIDEEVTRVVQALENDAKVARARLHSLETSLEQLQSGLQGQNSARIRLRELQRQADSSRQLYEAMLARFKQVRDSGVETPDARIIMAATAPTTPDFPNRPLLIAISAIVGVVAGVGFVVARERMSSGFRTDNDIETYLQTPMLAAIPNVDSADAEGLRLWAHVTANPLSQYADATRALLTSIRLSDIDAPPKVALIASAMPNEGKTTTAASLAAAATLSNFKTLAIDCDLRKMGLSRMFRRRADQPGVIEVLTGRNTLDEAIYRPEGAGFDLLPGGGKAASPGDLLGSDAFRAMLATLRERYDLVLLDTSPLMISDARSVARLADTCVLVVRWSSTVRDAAQQSLRILRDSHACVAGAALTRVDDESYNVYRYGYGNTAYYYTQDYRQFHPS